MPIACPCFLVISSPPWRTACLCSPMLTQLWPCRRVWPHALLLVEAVKDGVVMCKCPFVFHFKSQFPSKCQAENRTSLNYFPLKSKFNLINILLNILQHRIKCIWPDYKDRPLTFVESSGMKMDTRESSFLPCNLASLLSVWQQPVLYVINSRWTLVTAACCVGWLTVLFGFCLLLHLLETGENMNSYLSV